MKRRSRASSVKPRRRKAATPKRGAASNATRKRGASIAGQETVVARLTRERDEALLRETANSEILRLISRSPGDLELVFRTILEDATRICNANFGTLFRFDGENFYPVAQFNTPTALLEAQARRGPFQPEAGTAMEHVMRTKQVSHSADKAAEPAPGFFAEHGGARSQVAVPMLKDDLLIGVIVIYRQEVRPFTDKQIELVENFAAHAVIAIENARLLNELRESLERQTATSEVLKVISTSPSELQPVFQTILEKATRICVARFGTLYLHEDEKYRPAALVSASPELEAYVRERGAYSADPATPLGQLARTKSVVRTFAETYKGPTVAAFEFSKARTHIAVPMLKRDELIGAIAIYKEDERPFTDKQIALVQNFAAQAVIAIENARLLNELRQRTADLSESLEQQTATSEVLKVISSASGELNAVFEAILSNATRICEATYGNLLLLENGAFRRAAQCNAPQELIEEFQRNPVFVPLPNNPLARVLKTKETVHTVDAQAGSNLGLLANACTLLNVPMLSHGDLIGAISIYRREVRPFTEKQIALVQNFAAQAVIAIENARLLNELRESLEQQTATSEVLKVISSSPGELKPVFDTILESATRICEAKFGVLCIYDGNLFKYTAVWNAPPAFLEFMRQRGSFAPRAGTPLDQILKTKNIVHRADASVEEVLTDTVRLAGAKSHLTVPMFKDEAIVGAIIIYRQEVRPFTEKQIQLVKNFAAQAVIAIENGRLLSELRQSLEQQTATSEVLRVIASSRGELDAVFKTMLQKARHICDAKFGILMLCESDGFRSVAIDGAPPAYTEAMQQNPHIPPRPGSGLVVLVESKKPVQIADVQADPGYVGNRLTTLAGARTLLIVPLLKDGAVIGAINIYRQEVRAFTEQQIALLQNFAAQAVIAIENARLLNELRESLEQQTGTAEVLRVISSSPGELKPVFDAMLQNATRICEAKFGTLYLREGEGFRTVAAHNAPPAYLEARTRELIRPSPDTALGGVAATKRVVHIADIKTIPSYIERNPYIVTPIELGGYRTVLAVPMLKNNELIGVITINRQEVRPFTDKQIALVQNFAAQAVIAIENARLLNELRQRTEEVVKLNQQLEARVVDQVGEIERMGRLRRFLPPQVADLIVASGTEKQLESHRREITALFCDLRGFTGFSESADPEDVMTLLRHYHAAIGEIIIKYSGTLERYAGDGVMVVFNDPVPVDNPALQAVRMALDMRVALGSLIEKWRRLGHELGFGIGIAHGYATLGTIGFEGRFDYAAIGTVSNVASRLCDEAKPGQILISSRVLMAVEDVISVEPVGDFELKGISRPLAAYNVVGAK